GIDVDLFLERQPKERMMQKIGQQIRINRSKIKDTSDTNSDFDDLSNAIRSGYYLKEGLANTEDFYYAAILVTVTAASVKDLEWRIGEIRKLMVSQDMNLQLCSFRQEAAFLSSLPLCAPDAALFKKYRRNILTSSAASFYPFVSFELCDTNGVLLGVNKYNNSLVSLDNFNTRIYKNANMAILGTSGAGKTFTMQLIARRMRLAGTPVYIIAPLKGHEFYRQAKALNGTIIRIVPGSPDCINVMEIRKIDHTSSELLDGPMPEQSELAAKIQKLHIFFSLLIPDLSNEERQLLDEAIVTTYRNKGITYDNASLDDPARPGQYREMPILGDLHAVLSATPETRRIANILNRLVHGSASSFNRQTNVNLDNSYVVIDISELSGDLL
ncbi:MAG TPA: PrgI family protein, partial [Gemmiger formicilis]|nr:PrgI family protein [Gemmiger formicilis]